MTGKGRKMQILSVIPPRAIASWTGRLGIELEMAGLGVARFRFVLVDESDLIMVQSEPVVLEEGQSATLCAQADGEDVDMDWIQELDFATHSRLFLDHMTEKIMKGVTDGETG